MSLLTVWQTNSSNYNLFYISLQRNILLYSLLRKTIKSRWFMLSVDEGWNQDIHSYLCSYLCFIFYVDYLSFLSDRSNRNITKLGQRPNYVIDSTRTGRSKYPQHLALNGKRNDLHGNQKSTKNRQVHVHSVSSQELGNDKFNWGRLYCLHQPER